MPAYNFQTQFAEKVRTRQKRQTIRRRRKRPTKPGEELQLYTGMRTSRCRSLGEAVCQSVATVEIYNDEVWIEQRKLDSRELEEFAKADGFDSVEAFFRFFRKTHDLSEDNPLLDLELIKWD